MSIIAVIGCDRYDHQYETIITADKVTNVRVSCLRLLDVPMMCAVINETTKTVRIENVVTRIVNRIVRKEVVTEVPIEKIVKRIETRFIETGKEADIEEIVNIVIERVNEYVQPSDIIDVPKEIIVDETTDYISNPPQNEDKDTTTMGDIRQETPEDDNDRNNNQNTDDDNTNDNSNNDDTNDDESNGDTNEENLPDRTPDQDNDVNIDEVLTDEDRTPWTPPEGVSTVKLQVIIGPKKMDFSPPIIKPGLNTWVTCEIDDNTVHPNLNGYTVFKGDKRNLWGVEFWCDVPEDLDDSDTTIHINVSDYERWCGLTDSDVSVSKFIRYDDGSSNSIGTMDASINLSPNPVPACGTPPSFTDDINTIFSIEENRPPNVPIGTPLTATDEEDDTLEYSLKGTDGDEFSIESTTGQIKTKEPLDFETKNVYSVVVSVTDNSVGRDEITITINVTDMNEAPVFTENSPIQRSVAENTAAGEEFGDPVEATDQDGDTIEYSIALLVPGAFDIGLTSGKLITSAPLDFEDKNLYWATVTANDNNGGITSITLQIGINNVNEAPEFREDDSTNRAVLESAENGSNINGAISAKDVDGDSLTYSLSGTDASYFNINSNNGRLSINTILDYDTKDSYTVTVSVTDNNGGMDEISVSIEVLEFYIPKEEFYEVHYATYLEDGYLEVQIYTIRGYGYDGDTPIYVDNYYKFEDGSPTQTSTGWGSDTEPGTISYHIENNWKTSYTEDDGYEFANTTVSVHNRTADEAKKIVYQTICNVAKNKGTYTDFLVGFTFPEIDDNTSDGILSVTSMILYLADDDCDPNN